MRAMEVGDIVVATRTSTDRRSIVTGQEYTVTAVEGEGWRAGEVISIAGSGGLKYASWFTLADDS